MKIRLVNFGVLILTATVFATGCSIFESNSNETSENGFYRPVKGATNTTNGRAPGDAEFGDPANAANQPSAYGTGAGLDPNTYDGFGTKISGVKFDILYFEFDQDRISSSEMPKIDKVVAWLNGNPGHGVVIEGNCDNRGSEEYNRALGERRALTAQEQILAAGIAANRVKTISNGKAKPSAFGENESSWRLNRRDEFIPVKLLRP